MFKYNDRDYRRDKLLKKFLTDNPSAKSDFHSTDPAEIGEFFVNNAPAGTAQKWLSELMALNNSSTRLPSIGTLMLSVAGLVAGGSLIYGLFFEPAFLRSFAAPETARSLITFLFAFATIAVVLITVIASFWVSAEEVEKRGAVAKEILAILIGIMGTIMGFYFGSFSNEPPSMQPETNQTAID